jgi:hypothetical protein
VKVLTLKWFHSIEIQSGRLVAFIGVNADRRSDGHFVYAKSVILQVKS